MSIFTALIFLTLGLFIGSFLNVVILRLGTGKTFISGRSVCVHTGKPLLWYDMVPVVSFVILRGRSRFSGQPLSIQYPLVELITGLLFVATYWKIFGWGGQAITALLLVEFIIVLVIMCLLVIIAFYDMRTKIIPNPLVYTFIILSATLLAIKGPTFADIFAGPLLYAPIAFLWLISRGRWIGYGDAKFALGMGWFLGLILGISAYMLSFWIGAIISVGLLALKEALDKWMSFLPKTFTIKSEVPFGPFLILGTLIAYFFNLNVFLFF